MSSNDWETVTKSKKAKNLEKKVVAHVEKKRLEAILPKLEEIMPSQQYKNLISGKTASPAKEKSPKTVPKPLSKQDTVALKKAQSTLNQQQQQQQQQQLQQQQQQVQSRANADAQNKSKSLESALRAITPEEFEGHLEQLRLAYPGSELLWLKGVASFLNSKLLFDCDAVFSGKSFAYPSNLATAQLKSNIVYFLETMGVANLSYFYHTLLVSMTMELSKNAPVVGYKLLLQLIGQNWPEVCSNNLAKTALLRNSYQNRSVICLSIMWAIGQGGYLCLTEAVRVWQNLMLPCLELRSYTKYVTDYMEKVLQSSKDQSLNLNQVDFFITYNALRTNYPGLGKDANQSLQRSAALYLEKYIDSSSKHANLFLTLFRDSEDMHRNRIELDGCIRCLIRGEDSFKVWRMNYKKKLPQNIFLLEQIMQEWDAGAAPLVVSKSFQSFLEDAKLLNAELLMGKRKDQNIPELVTLIETVQEKSAAQQKKNKQNADAGAAKKKCGCCKWLFGSLLLIGLIAAALNYDTHVNGKGVFERSATGKALKNAGVLPHVQRAWYASMSTSARGYKWAEQHVPPYAKPAGKLVCDLYKVSRNAACNLFGAVRELVNAKLPVAAQFLEQYVPGLPVKIESGYTAAKNLLVDVYGKVVNIIKTQVLVGRFSPENLSKTANQTRNAALEYYNLFHKKVDAYAKLK